MYKLFFIFIFFLLGCSHIPSKNVYKNFLNTFIGKNLNLLVPNNKALLGLKIKTINKSSTIEHYYIDRDIGGKPINCKFVFITDKSNIIQSYKILTPDTCVGYYSPVF